MFWCESGVDDSTFTRCETWLALPSAPFTSHRLAAYSSICLACTRLSVESSARPLRGKVCLHIICPRLSLTYPISCRLDCHEDPESPVFEDDQEGDFEAYGDVHQEGGGSRGCEWEFHASIARRYPRRLQPQRTCSSRCGGAQRHGDYHRPSRGVYITRCTVRDNG